MKPRGRRSFGTWIHLQAFHFFAWVLRKLGDPTAIERAFREAVREVSAENGVEVDEVETIFRQEYADMLPKIARKS